MPHVHERAVEEWIAFGEQTDRQPLLQLRGQGLRRAHVEVGDGAAILRIGGGDLVGDGVLQPQLAGAAVEKR